MWTKSTTILFRDLLVGERWIDKWGITYIKVTRFAMKRETRSNTSDWLSADPKEVVFPLPSILCD